MTPARAATLAAAAYHTGLPDAVWEVVAENEVAQIRLDHEGLHVAIPGSNDPEDWRLNRDFDLVLYLGAEVHEGFLQGWKRLEEPLREQMLTWKGDKIFLYGHSHGGAVAQLAAATINTWSEHKGNLKEVHLFGCPRVGTRRFTKLVERSCPVIYRYETVMLPIPGFRDPVPHLPPKLLGFRQPGKVVRLRAFGRPSQLHKMETYRKAIGRIS